MDIIRDGVNGVLVPPEDPAAMAEAMVRILGDEALRSRMATQAQEVIQRFSHARVMDLWDGAIRAAKGTTPRASVRGAAQ
jgi:glycosyltransferase involved in cell wall biosynthesis